MEISTPIAIIWILITFYAILKWWRYFIGYVCMVAYMTEKKYELPSDEEMAAWKRRLGTKKTIKYWLIY